MKCLKCEKPLSMLPDMPANPDGAGEIVVSFGYGSRHDQCSGWGGMPPPSSGAPRHHRLTNTSVCNEVRAYVCDDCFEQYAHLFEGWSVRRVRPEERKVL